MRLINVSAICMFWVFLILTVDKCSSLPEYVVIYSVDSSHHWIMKTVVVCIRLHWLHLGNYWSMSIVTYDYARRKLLPIILYVSWEIFLLPGGSVCSNMSLTDCNVWSNETLWELLFFPVQLLYSSGCGASGHELLDIWAREKQKTKKFKLFVRNFSLKRKRVVKIYSRNSVGLGRSPPGSVRAELRYKLFFHRLIQISIHAKNLNKRPKKWLSKKTEKVHINRWSTIE